MSVARYAVATIIITLAIPVLLAAHGNGASFERQSGSYLIDIGYEPESPEAGQQIKFDFSLLRQSDGEEHPYSHVWVRVLQEDRTVFASGIHRQDIGQTTLLYVFEEEGEYVLEASYRNESGEIASAKFPLTVAPADGAFVAEDDVLPALAGLVAGVVLAGAYVFIRKSRPN